MPQPGKSDKKKKSGPAAPAKPKNPYQARQGRERSQLRRRLRHCMSPKGRLDMDALGALMRLAEKYPHLVTATERKKIDFLIAQRPARFQEWTERSEQRAEGRFRAFEKWGARKPKTKLQRRQEQEALESRRSKRNQQPETSTEAA